MRFSFKVACHCDRCPGTGIGNYSKRLMPDGRWKEDLEPPDGWGTLTCKPPLVQPVGELPKPTAIMPGRELATVLGVEVIGLGCKRCIAEVSKEKPLIEAAQPFGGKH